MQLCARVRVAIGQGKGPGNKSTHAGRDKHGSRRPLRATCAGQGEPPIVLALQALDLLPQVEGGVHGRDLRLQALHQFAPCAHTDGGDVVNRLVSVEFDALATHVGQGVDNMGPHAMQAELEDLEQTHRPRADDQGVSGGGFHGGPADCVAASGSANQRGKLVGLVFPIVRVG